MRGVDGGIYKITQLLPERDGDMTYRIVSSEKKLPERNVPEHHISPLPGAD
jgi:hypothetical protein